MNHKITTKRQTFWFRFLLFLAIAGFQEISFAQTVSPVTVTGKVTSSEDHSGLPGVNVLIKGTTTGTTTNADGEYEIQIEEGGVLSFSFVGFMTREITVRNQNVIDVNLDSDQTELSEVVVVGYGTQLKQNVTTAISSLSAGKIKEITVANAAQAMVGQVAGVNLQQISGEPGAAPSIRIRGNGSISSENGPLYVIDGYPTDDASLFNAISPIDIESIDILKDAASAAIYGSRAGNGVIIVTTKKGQLGEPVFTFNANVGFQEVSKKYDMAGPELFAEVAREAILNRGGVVPDILTDKSQWVITDWQDIIFRPAPMQTYQLGASGASEKINYNVSFGVTDQQGILVNSFMKRYTFRGGLTAKLSDKFKVGFNIAPAYTHNRLQQPQGRGDGADATGTIHMALNMPPILPRYKPNGDYFVSRQDPEAIKWANPNLANPLSKLDANEDYASSLMTTGNVFLAFEPIKGLTLTSTLNAGITDSKRETYMNAFLANGNGNTGNISTPNLAQIKALRANTAVRDLYWSNTAAYDFSIKEKHFITALLGYDASYQSNNMISVFPRTDADNPIAFTNTIIKNVQGASLIQGESAKEEYGFDAIFSRLNYSFKDKYLLSVSIRRDRSSRFGPNNKVGIFPSVSAGWNLVEESFMKPVEFVSFLKVRASYGETGNDRLSGFYPWISALSPSFAVFGQNNVRALGFGPTGFSNQQLGWEKNKQVDFGADLGFFQDRLNVTFDLYERNSNSIITAAVPSLNGKANSVIQNVGNIRNRGLEITVNSVNLTGKFGWKTALNFSSNQNMITDLGSDMSFLPHSSGGTYFGQAVRNYAGRPMGDFYMYIHEGTFNNAADVEKYAKLGTQTIGDLRFKDVSGPEGVPDGKVTTDDLVRVGNYQPDFSFGIGNTFTYGNFDLNILLNGSYGGEIIDALQFPTTVIRERENMTREAAENRWISEENPGNGNYQKAGSPNIASNLVGSTRYLFDASYLRIRNITLGYNLPASIGGKASIKNARIFASVLNLHTFTSFPGYNPEENFYGDNATANGVSQGSYPLARNYSVGINVTF